MKNIWTLFLGDLRRLRGNVVTIIAIVGLIALPSIFSWYNILACWNVFDNTGNLTVAVANSDEGYKSDLVSVNLNIGDEITSALRANDQLDWVFTDEEDAIDGVKAGRYYAAVVIPSTFSRDMMSFYSDDVAHARITYYSNQKKSAIAPKVTDQGADKVASEVNKVFAETVSEIVLGISSSVLDRIDEGDVGGRLTELTNHMQHLSVEMDSASSALGAYSAVLASSQSLITESEQLVGQAQDNMGKVSGTVSEARDAAGTASEKIGGAKSSLESSLSQLDADYASLPSSVESAYAAAASAAADAEQLLRDEASVVAGLGNAEGAKRLNAAADEVRSVSSSAQASKEDATALAAEARQGLASAKVGFDQDLKPKLEALSSALSDAKGSITSEVSAIESTSADLSDVATTLDSKLGATKQKIDAAVSELDDSSKKLAELSQRLNEAIASDDLTALRKIIGSDPEALASAVAAPVKLERVAVYPVENFGSAMAPLYTSLALWIGALLIMVMLKVTPSERSLRDLKNPTERQVFIGRFLIIATISLLQSTVLSVGNLLFLGVQAEEPLLYLICFWVSGLTFAFIMYTMVALFANLGKALGVVLLIVQVGGGGGSFPLPLLPQFFQTMSPYLPITHTVNAMRAAMFGVYNGDFWVQIGMLVLSAIPFFLLGIVFIKPLSKIVPRFVERVEQSKLM